MCAPKRMYFATVVDTERLVHSRTHVHSEHGSCCLFVCLVQWVEPVKLVPKSSLPVALAQGSQEMDPLKCLTE
jgi:hypothetical protein